MNARIARTSGKMNGPVRRELERLRAGEISFDQFAVRTKAYWLAHAERMLKRWQVPASLTPQDVVQEMLLGAWAAARRYDAKSHVAFHTFVVVGAMHEGLRCIHATRRAKRRDGRQPSRFDVCESSLRRYTHGDGDEMCTVLDLAVAESFDVDAALDVRHRIERAITASVDNKPRAYALAAFSIEGDVQLAARLLHRDRECRKVLQLHSRREIAKLVLHHIATT